MQSIEFRSRMLIYATLAVAVLFSIRLFYVQVIRYSYYSSEAQSEHLKKFEIAAKRGKIYLKDGDDRAPVVLNESVSTVFVDPSFINLQATAEESLEIIDSLSGELNIGREDLQGILDQTDSQYQVVARSVVDDKASRLKGLKLKGVGFLQEQKRAYPEGRTASQVLGFVDSNRAGQYGVEQQFDKELAGKNGLLKTVTDVNGVPLPTNGENIQQPAVDGSDLVLTIDRSVQQYVDSRIEDAVKEYSADRASAIVMEANSGRVLAMSNYPNFDPEEYANVSDLSVFVNDTVSSAYEPGSVIKPFTMSTALNEGAVRPDDVWFDTGAAYIDDTVVQNADFSGGTDRTMTNIIQYSLNTGIVHVLRQMGGGEINQQVKDELYSYFTSKFGFGTMTGINLFGEATGTVISPNEEQGNRVRYANMGFGQGMSATMVQIAAAYVSLVNGGDYYQPQIVDSVISSDGSIETFGKDPQRLGVISEETSSEIKYMMKAVVDSSGVYDARRQGYYIGGKTGTAQIPDEQGGYKQDGFIGSYAGFGGGSEDDIDYVVVVRIDEPQVQGYEGSAAAGPVFADISDFMIDHLQIAPEMGAN